MLRPLSVSPPFVHVEGPHWTGKRIPQPWLNAEFSEQSHTPSQRYPSTFCHSSETGRIQLRRVRFKAQSSVSFLGPRWVPGRALSELLLAYDVCVRAKANGPSSPHNPPKSVQNSPNPSFKIVLAKQCYISFLLPETPILSLTPWRNWTAEAMKDQCQKPWSSAGTFLAVEGEDKETKVWNQAGCDLLCVIWGWSGYLLTLPKALFGKVSSHLVLWLHETQGIKREDTRCRETLGNRIHPKWS